MPLSKELTPKVIFAYTIIPMIIKQKIIPNDF